MDHPSDHSLVVLRLRVCSEARNSEKRDPGPTKFVNDDHILACKLALRNSTPPRRTPDTPAATWWIDTIAWITDIMKKTKPRRVATPKKDWLSAQTWQGMLYAADLRKYYSLRQRSLNNFLLKVCLTAWKTHPPDDSL
eukprot:6475139-Amphidinium_carterae.1